MLIKVMDMQGISLIMITLLLWMPIIMEYIQMIIMLDKQLIWI